jgi:hypothetical protein
MGVHVLSGVRRSGRYLVDGVTGATSGFLVPVGPLVLVWLFGAR